MGGQQSSNASGIFFCPGRACVGVCVCLSLQTTDISFKCHNDNIVKDATVASREQQSVYCNRNPNALCLQTASALETVNCDYVSSNMLYFDCCYKLHSFSAKPFSSSCSMEMCKKKKETC